MNDFVKIKYTRSTDARVRRIMHTQIANYLYDSEPEMSTVVLELKNRNGYKINKILTKTKIYAGNLTSESDIELLQLRRYFATIRALEHNCKFIRMALSVKSHNYLDNLTNLSFSYINDKTSNDSHKLTKALALNSSRIEINLNYTNINQILNQSIHFIEEFEKKLNLDNLTNSIANFESIYNNALKAKTKVINDATNILNSLSHESGQNLLKYASTKISETSTLKK